jgi:Flp pilus assembly protein TadD
MKWILAFALAFCVGLGTAQAQSADDQYVGIYGLIQQADTFAGNGQPGNALPLYVQAQAQLQRFQKMYPAWDAEIVNYRLSDLTTKIAALQAQAPSASTASATSTNAVAGTPAPAPATDQVQTLQAQLQAVQNENTALQAKLKEALSTEPAMVDSTELTKAQEQIRVLMKENDLLKVSATTAAKPAGDPQLLAQIAALRARVAADEAAPMPYSPEELALLQTGANSAPAATPPAPLAAADAALVTSAKQHFANHEFAAAEADYQKVLDRNPDNIYVLSDLATIEMQDNKLAAAEKHIQQALAQAPNDAYSLATLGKIKFTQAQYDDALTALTRAAQLDPNNPEVQNFLGLTYDHKGLRQPAENALRRAVELDPNYAPAQNNLAVVYLNENPPSPQLARWHYQKAIDAGQPHNPDVEKMLANDGAPVSAPASAAQ